MKRIIAGSTLLFLFGLFLDNGVANTGIGTKSGKAGLTWQHQSGFRKNIGQWSDEILYKGSSNHVGIYFQRNRLSFGHFRGYEMSGNTIINEKHARDEVRALVWEISFEGSLKDVSVNASGASPSNFSYINGKDPSRWAPNIPVAEEIEYRNLYTNIDLRYYFQSESNGPSSTMAMTKERQLKYDFIIRPGGNIGDIKINYKGIQSLSIYDDGSLQIQTLWDQIHEKAPYTYQLVDGRMKEIRSGYYLVDEFTVGFRLLDKYDRSLPVIVDPVILAYGTFIGSIDPGTGYIRDLEVDAQGYAYACGFFTENFPVTSGVFDSIHNTGASAPFAMKLSPDASVLEFATYIDHGEANSLAINDLGELYIVGETTTDSFPTTVGALCDTFNGSYDVFALHLSASGNNLIYSTYIGGVGQDKAYDVEITTSGEAFITGGASPGFPTTAGAYKETMTDVFDVFVSKLSSDGSSLIFSTFIGGDGGNVWERAHCLDTNSLGEVIVGGITAASNFPTTPGAFNEIYNGDPSDAFISIVSSNGSTLLYSTFIGGSSGPPLSFEGIMALDVVPTDTIYATGFTSAPLNFPITPGAYDATRSFKDAYVAKFSPDLSTLHYATYLGGTGAEEPYSISVNELGEAFIAGYTTAADFPVTTCALDTTPGTGPQNGHDAFLSKISNDGKELQFSTYLSENYPDYFPTVILSQDACSQEVYVATTTHSPPFPTTPGTFQPAWMHGPPSTGYPDQPTIIKLKPDINMAFSYTEDSCSFSFVDGTTGGCIWSDASWQVETWFWDFGDGITSTDPNPLHFYKDSGTYDVQLAITCPYDTITQQIVVSKGCCTDPIDSSQDIACFGDSSGEATVSGQGFGPWTYIWEDQSGNTIQNDPLINGFSIIDSLTTGIYTVTITDSIGCLSVTDITITEPPDLSLSSSTDSAHCGQADGSASVIAVGGSGNYTYQWNGSAGSQNTSMATGLSAAVGSYSVVVTDSNGCQEQIDVPVYNIPGPIVSLPPVSFCPGDSVLLDAGTGLFSYLWCNNEVSQSIIVSDSGICWVEITDPFGCKDIDTANITIYPEPQVSLPEDTTILLGESVHIISNMAGGSTNCEWIPVDYLDFPKDCSPISTPTQTITYVIEVIDINGCRNSDTITVIVEKEGFHLYIPNAFTPNGDANNDFFEIKGVGIGGFELVIYDRWGSIVFESNNIENRWNGKFLDQRNVQEDVYVYALKVTPSENTSESHKYIGRVSVVR